GRRAPSRGSSWTRGEAPIPWPRRYRRMFTNSPRAESGTKRMSENWKDIAPSMLGDGRPQPCSDRPTPMVYEVGHRDKLIVGNRPVQGQLRQLVIDVTPGQRLECVGQPLELVRLEVVGRDRQTHTTHGARRPKIGR